MYFQYICVNVLLKHYHLFYLFILIGDGRMDSPGWSAKYCTYTMIEYDSKEILDMFFVDKRMVEGKSPNMEALGFLKALNNIIAAGINVVEVVTDAHISITATMSEYRYQFFWKLNYKYCYQSTVI